MDYNWMDATVAVLMFIGFVHGLVKGAIQEISGALAVVVGILVAGYVTAGTADFADRFSHPIGARVFIFVVTFIAVAILIGLIGKLVSGLAKAANLRLIDRIIGGVVGACIVGIIIGIILTLVEHLGVNIDPLRESGLVRYLLQAVSYLSKFLPKVTEELNASDLPL